MACWRAGAKVFGRSLSACGREDAASGICTLHGNESYDTSRFAYMGFISRSAEIPDEVRSFTTLL